MQTQAILEQESRIAGFKGEVAKSQELHLASLSRDTERLTNSLEKMRAEIKCAPAHEHPSLDFSRVVPLLCVRISGCLDSPFTLALDLQEVASASLAMSETVGWLC
jgi:hypothetical protein